MGIPLISANGALMPRLTAALAILFAIASLAFAQAGKPNDIFEMHAGFRGIPWGLSQEEIQAQGIRLGSPDIQGRAVNMPVKDGTPLTVNSIPVRMSFTFIDKKFSGVVIVPAELSTTPELTAFFVRQFGQPAFSDHQSQKHAWQDDAITITLQVANNAVAFILMNNENFRTAGIFIEDYVSLGVAALKPKPGGI